MVGTSERPAQGPGFASRLRHLLRNRWLVFATVLALIAVASVTSTAVRARPNGCIFDDGVAYCRMASGKLANRPFSRRVVVPKVVSWLPGGWSLSVRFRLVALLAASAATIATGLLTLRLVRDRAPPDVAYSAALAAAALVALSPHFFRMALTTPVYVDQAAIFLALLWCLLVTSEERWLRTASPFVVLLLVPTREAWVLPLLLASGVLWWMRHRALAGATLVATLAASAFTFTLPTGPGPWSNILQLHYGRLALTHPHRALWAVFFGVGFVAALALLLFLRWQSLRGPLGVVLALACGPLVQAVAMVFDVARVAAAALPFAVALAIVVTIEIGTRRAFWALVALSGATVLLWQPFRVPAHGATAYLSMYTPGGGSAVIALGGLVLIATTLTWLLRSVAPRVGQISGSSASH